MEPPFPKTSKDLQIMDPSFPKTSKDLRAMEPPFPTTSKDLPVSYTHLILEVDRQEL